MLAAILLLSLVSGDPWKEFYSAALGNEGLSEPEAQAHIALGQAYIATHPGEALTAHFNRMYIWAEAPFSREASAPVKKVAATRKPERALDIPVGQGRNEDYDPGQSQWNLIVMSFAFTSLSDTAYMKRVHDSLWPAGVLIVAGFNSGKRIERNMILKAFLDYHVLLFEDLPDIADWGKVKAPLLRIAVERP